MAKKRREINFKPNFLFYWIWYKLGLCKNKINPETGKKSVPVFVSLGGTRSAKTFSEIQLIYKVLTDMPNAGIRANVYRDTLVSCRKNTLIDFKDCFQIMKLEPDVDYVITGEISGTPQITIKGNTINFLGYPEVGKQANKCHIAFINEVLDSDNSDSVDNILQRCEMFAMIDANPAKTAHFIYERKDWFNWHYSQTTYLDNDYLADGLAGLYESKCAWDLRDSKIMVYDYIPSMPAGWVKDEKGEKLFFNGFRRRVWTKEECPDNYIDQSYPNNKYRAPHELNIKNGTADRYWWLTFGEGIPASREGQIFKDIKWIEKFPESGYDHVWFSADWGYTCFDAETPIEMNDGIKKIKDIVIGDIVKTENGYNKVIETKNNGVKLVVEKILYFDFGYRKIICTFDHKFKTNKGWKQLQDIQEGEKLFMTANFKEKFTQGIQMGNTQTTFSQNSAKKGFIGRFGNFIMAKFHKTNKYIISMGIRLIMKLLILCLYLGLNTVRYTKLLKGMFAKKDLQKRIGLNEEKLSLKILRTLSKNANIAESISHLQMCIRGSVLRNAIISGNTLHLRIMNYISVNGVAALLKGINFLNQKHVQLSAQGSWHKILSLKNARTYFSNVYDLTIENEHNYFANGMLVHNCDNTVLARTGYSKGKNLTIDIIVCEPTKTPEITWIAFKNALAKEEERRKKEGEKNYDSFWICCDSVDAYMGENWVEALNNYAYQEGKNYNFFKIMKGSISARVDLLKMFNLTIVDHPRMKIEAINYVYQKINGESTNQPDPHSKFCDCWDAIGYGIWQNGHGLE